jgi:hypothetical protein
LSISRYRQNPLSLPNVSDYAPVRAVVVVVEAHPFDPCHGATVMIILTLVLGVFGIGFFCWLLFTLAVYALPFFAGVTAGLVAYHSGSGAIGGFLVGLIAGIITLVMGQIMFAAVRSPLIRALIALLFAIPACLAGYFATLGLARIGMPSTIWREIFAVIGAMAVGGTAWARMTALASPNIRLRMAAGQAHLPLASTARDR